MLDIVGNLPIRANCFGASVAYIAPSPHESSLVLIFAAMENAASVVHKL